MVAEEEEEEGCVLGKHLTASLLQLLCLLLRSDDNVPPSKRQDTIGSSAR